jgi:hypothetical protein
MSRSIPLPDLGRWLASESASDRRDVALLAGHFALFSAGSEARDLLDDNGLTGPMAEMVAFTQCTWRAACEAAADLGKRAPQLVVLTDDIQFIRPAVGNKATAEKLAAALAVNYLEQNPSLPPFHRRLLDEHHLTDGVVLAHSSRRAVFSERELRIAAVRHLRQELAEGRGSDLEASADGQTVTVTLPEHGDYCLVHSGRTTCAGGYIELLAALHARGVRKLISMVPMRCVGPVGLGTVLARRLFPLSDLEVVNVAIPDPSLMLPAHAFTEAP